MRLIHGDCLSVMPALDVDSIDAVVCDPPYGLEFMGKGWDRGVPGVEFWTEALRVTKPGAYLLAFGGTRTFHRLTCAIEDAGFEIQDCLSWLYGSGFPKHRSKLKPAWEPIVLARKPAKRATPLNVDACRIGSEPNTSHITSLAACSGNKLGHPDGWGKRPYLESRENVGRWPANVVLDEEAARALDEQTGELATVGGPKKTTHSTGMFGIGQPGAIYRDTGGASRFFYCAKASRSEREAGLGGFSPVQRGTLNEYSAPSEGRTANKAGGGPARNHHPTVKPLALMRWLCRLVTPPNGRILDPFCGSGTTGIAAMLEGFDFIGIEREEQYIEIARARIANATPPLFAAIA